MNWTELSYKCNKQSEASDCLTTLQKASQSEKKGNISYICSNNQKVFSIDKWKKTNGLEAHDVDCMYVSCDNSNQIPNRVVLIEFKGGRTIDDWIDTKNDETLIYKFFDTLHCILPDLLGYDLWKNIFDEKCQLDFVIGIESNHNIIKEQSDFDKSKEAKSRIKSRNKSKRITRRSEELKTIENVFRRYAKRTPFSNIIIAEARNLSIGSSFRGYYYNISLGK
ncbi:MAG: hypothetical protein EOL97_02225 [Spirochaetia bacterium]|nr:hypothetical protein [Spirochaetia bacterium]